MASTTSPTTPGKAPRRPSSRTLPPAVLLPKAICGGPERPLRIGDFSVPVFVLDDERRILSASGMAHSLAHAAGGENALWIFLDRDWLRPSVSDQLRYTARSPIPFLAPSRSIGYEVTILPEICQAVLAAREAGRIRRKAQWALAERCEQLLLAFAKIGIIGLVDEATGYQEIRQRDALHALLAQYIAPERLPWTQRFPDEFYKQMFRLWGWDYVHVDKGPRGPRYAAQLTNLLVYDKLPPGVLSILQEKSPLRGRGQRRDRLHQFLTPQIGQLDLEKQVLAITVLMKTCADKDEFLRKVNILHPDTFLL